METSPTPIEPDALDPLYRTDLKQIIEAMPAARHLGVVVTGFDKAGRSRVELTIRREHTLNGRTVQAVGAQDDPIVVAHATTICRPFRLSQGG